MRLFSRAAIIGSGLMLVSTDRLAFDRVLDVEPRFQETAAWCWATAAEMIFRYYDIPNINPGNDYQCGIVALVAPICNVNCANCPVSARSVGYLAQVIRNYPIVAGQVANTPVPHLVPSMFNYALSADAIRKEIDAGRPFVAGISPSAIYVPPGATPAHAVVIIGYEDNEEGSDKNPTVIVNDPFPYHAVGQFNDPYQAAGGEMREEGQYAISLSRLRGALHWTASIRVRCSGSDCPDTTE